MTRHPETLTFSRAPLSARVFLRELLKYEGLDYSIGENWAWRNEDGLVLDGNANCFGVLLMTAIDCGLWDGDPNLPPALYDGQNAAKTLAEILDYNFTEVPVSEVRECDILSLRYRDVDPGLREPHHVAAFVGWETRGRARNGSFFHASQEAQKCIRSPFDALIQSRVEKVLRLPNLRYD